MARTATMKVWNVELGLAVHITSPNGKKIVIDLGSSSTVSPLASLSPFSKIDFLSITHPHYDHISDIRNLTYYKRPRVFYANPNLTRNDIMPNIRETEKPAFEAYFDLLETYTSPISDSESLSDNNAFGGLTAQMFRPYSYSGTNINNYSSIIVFTLGNAKIVVCGDNEEESFKELMARRDFREAVSGTWVLVAAHHGRDSGYYKDFVNLVHPYITIISDTHKSKTSVTDKYTAASIGREVYDHSLGKYVDRKCLTTRNDGNVTVEFGETDSAGYSGYLQVECNV